MKIGTVTCPQILGWNAIDGRIHCPQTADVFEHAEGGYVSRCSEGHEHFFADDFFQSEVEV